MGLWLSFAFLGEDLHSSFTVTWNSVLLAAAGESAPRPQLCLLAVLQPWSVLLTFPGRISDSCLLVTKHEALISPPLPNSCGPSFQGAGAELTNQPTWPPAWCCCHSGTPQHMEMFCELHYIRREAKLSSSIIHGQLSEMSISNKDISFSLNNTL